MSRQLEQQSEERTHREMVETYLACVGGLESALARSGAELLGFSARGSGGEYLITLRVFLAGRKQIAFVGSETLSGCLRKAVREAKRDKLTYRADRFEEKVS
jgi:hypothetical protein